MFEFENDELPGIAEEFRFQVTQMVVASIGKKE
jgi:hypothetical protein